MSTPTVRAVLVTDATSSHLPASLAALAQSQVSPHSIEIVVVGDAPLELPPWLVATVTRSERTSYAHAVNAAVAATPARDGELIWLLHDDVAPEPGALGALVATMAKRRRAAIVGAAHSRWSDSSRLVNAGTTVSRLGARRIGLVVEDDINQGQHDWRDDVLAVSLAAALVRRDAWDQLGGIDPGYQGFGSSLEWCRRAWASGHDVVIEPRATVRHAQESLYGKGLAAEGRLATHVQRRVGEWHHAFAWAGPLTALALAVLVPFSVAARVLVRLAQSSPAHALAELAVPFALAARIPAIAKTARARRAVGSAKAVPAELFAGPRQVIDAVRHKEFGPADKARAQALPSDMERAELARAQARHRRSGAFAAVMGIAASAALAAPWIETWFGSTMLAAPAMGVSNVSASALWSRLWTGWSDQGFGGTAIDGNFAGLMLILAALPGGTERGIAAVLSLAIAIAVVVAWWAAGAVTRGPWMRVAAGIVYGLWPPFLQSILDARLGAVIVHLALPLAALGVARTAGLARGEFLGSGVEFRREAPRAAAAPAASLACAVIVAAQPVLLFPLLGGLAAIAVAARTSRSRVIGIGVLPLVMSVPTLVAAVRAFDDFAVAASLLAREPGPSGPWEGTVLDVLVGSRLDGDWPQFASAFDLLPVAVLALLVLAALVGFISRGGGAAARAGVVVAGVGALTAAWSAWAIGAYADPSGRSDAHAWPGAGLSLVALGLLTAGLAGHGRLVVGEGRARKGARVLAGLSAWVGVMGLGAVLVATAWPGSPRGEVSVVDRRVLPLAVALGQGEPSYERALVVSASGDGQVTYDVLAGDGATLLTGGADLGPDGDSLVSDKASQEPSLARTVGELSLSPQSDLTMLQAWGLTTIVVAPQAQGVAAMLDQREGVSLGSGSERGATYRIDGGVGARAWIEKADTLLPLASERTRGSLSANDLRGNLVIAVPADDRWTAYGDGVRLEAVADPYGRASFAVPEGVTEVSYEYRDRFYDAYKWVALVVLATTAIGALNMRRIARVEP